MNAALPVTPREGPAGQALVIFALALVAILGMVALVIDGGNAFAQQRATQNAIDASADAGATVLLNNVAAQTLTGLPKTDQDVLDAVNAAADDNGIGAPTAYYTTISGRCILADGTSAAPPCDAAPGAVEVGSGAIPTVEPDASGNPQCPLPYLDSAGDLTSKSTPASACGVSAKGSKDFPTFVAGVLGINRFTATATATAVSGGQTGVCPAGTPCGFLPITFPTSLTACGKTNHLDFGNSRDYKPLTAGTALAASNEVTIPICGTGPGSVGWLSIQPEDANGVADLAADIVTPDNPPLYLPLWINAQTGNTNSTLVEDALNSNYAGNVVGTYEPGLDDTVTIPLYDCTADVKVVGGQQNPATSPAECSGLSPGYDPGNGAGMYYHIPSIAGFVLDHAYIQGDNSTVCNSAPGTVAGYTLGGNGGTGCLKGWLVNISSPSTPVGVGYGTPTSAYGVQLIR